MPSDAALFKRRVMLTDTAQGRKASTQNLGKGASCTEEGRQGSL